MGRLCYYCKSECVGMYVPETNIRYRDLPMIVMGCPSAASKRTDAAMCQ